MAPITTTTEVARPPAQAFAYVTDPSRFVEWQRNVVSGHMDGEGPHGVGARCLTTRRIGFADRPVTSEILLVPLVVRREARKEMPANLLAFKERLEDQP